MEKIMQSYSNLTTLKVGRTYKAGESFPHEYPVGTFEVTIKEYVQFKDLPCDVQDDVEDGFDIVEYHDDYYDMIKAGKFSQIPLPVATGSDGNDYVLVRMDNEWEAIGVGVNKYLIVPE